MKNIFVLIAAFLAVSIKTNFVFAQNSAEFFIAGTVPLINTAEVVPLPESQSLNILEGETERLVARVNETSNSPRGYRVLVSSENSSRLRNTSQPNAFVNYTLSYGGARPVVLANSNQEVKRVPSVDGLVTNVSEVRVSLDKEPQALVGTYTDTVSISISAD
ncbi:MAG: fimbrial protein [Pseudobdellovibrio sp.]|jgi:hypothetical protein|nr:fimbrial protein [Pseudobdellovibrio sp.]